MENIFLEDGECDVSVCVKFHQLQRICPIEDLYYIMKLTLHYDGVSNGKSNCQILL